MIHLCHVWTRRNSLFYLTWLHLDFTWLHFALIKEDLMDWLCLICDTPREKTSVLFFARSKGCSEYVTSLNYSWTLWYLNFIFRSIERLVVPNTVTSLNYSWHVMIFKFQRWLIRSNNRIKVVWSMKQKSFDYKLSMSLMINHVLINLTFDQHKHIANDYLTIQTKLYLSSLLSSWNSQSSS